MEKYTSIKISIQSNFQETQKSEDNHDSRIWTLIDKLINKYGARGITQPVSTTQMLTNTQSNGGNLRSVKIK